MPNDAPAKRRTINLPVVDRELDKWLQLKDDLSSNYDHVDVQTMLDTCEGETELYEVLAMLAEDIKLKEAQIFGIRAAEDELAQRKKRLNNTIGLTKAAIQQAMEIAEIDTIQAPVCTLSIGKRAASTEIDDESKIPSWYWKKPDPTLDRTALYKDLKAGKTVPGARLGEPGKSLSISMK